MQKLYKMEAESFNDLPMRCKEMFFEKMEEYLINGNGDYSVFLSNGFDYSSCKSPIEKIFCFAFDIVCAENNMIFNLQPQYEVHGKSGNKYYADFLFAVDDCFQEVYTSCYAPKVIFECDGYDYHSSKAQIKHDNERDLDLKLAGFSTVHFSGSQIFENPWKCARQALCFLLNKLGKIERVK